MGPYIHATFSSTSLVGVEHHTTVSQDGRTYWYCDCPSYKFPRGRIDRRCKHIRAVCDALATLGGAITTESQEHPWFIQERERKRSEADQRRAAREQRILAERAETLRGVPRLGPPDILWQ